MSSFAVRLRSFISFAALALLVPVSATADGSRGDSPFGDVLRLVGEGRRTFRFDTFGDEAFWGETLRLHEAFAQTTPRHALELGLKVDVEALPHRLAADLRRGRLNLDDPANTVALLRQNAVVGVTGFFDPAGQLVSVGTQCALCHSSVDDALVPGVGRRLDGWANRDLDIGRIIASAPDLSTFERLLGVSRDAVVAVLEDSPASTSTRGRAGAPCRTGTPPSRISRWADRAPSWTAASTTRAASRWPHAKASRTCVAHPTA